MFLSRSSSQGNSQNGVLSLPTPIQLNKSLSLVYRGKWPSEQAELQHDFSIPVLLRTADSTYSEKSKTNSMLHNGLLDLMNRSTCFGHYYAHHQELATIEMVSAYGSSPWLWQVAGLVHGCRFLERPVRGMFHEHPSNRTICIVGSS